MVPLCALFSPCGAPRGPLDGPRAFRTQCPAGVKELEKLSESEARRVSASAAGMTV